MAPNYETNAPRGYMGDPRRGAAMGRPAITPDKGTPEELEARAADLEAQAAHARAARETRISDGFKRDAWQAAAAHFERAAKEAREAIPAARARLAASPEITLQRVRLNAGGYDPSGAYFGHGAPLYWAADESGAYDVTFRAADRAAAKAHVRQTYPGAKFAR